jgi:hypothetical protein
MFRHERLLIRVVLPVAAAVTLVLVASASASAPRHFSQVSIAGLKLGMTKSQVKAVLGKAVTQSGTYDNPGQPEGWRALVFPKAEVAAYFEKGRAGAVMVTTWNPAIRNSQGVGPCTKISKLKSIYGGSLKPSQHNIDPQGNVYAYTLGARLMLGADGAPPNPSKTVTAVGLYNGKPGFQGYAGFVTDSEQNCG